MHDEDPSIYPFQDWGSPTGKEYSLLLYTLPAVAGLSGGTLRIANSFMTQIVGGRNVVYHSSIMVMIAMIWTTSALTSKTPPFNLLLVGAWLSGTGGGAFASSMSNMSFLYPKRQQGYCLGFNGGFGNLGVSMTQLLVPIFMGWSFGKEPLAEGVEGWPNHGKCCNGHKLRCHFVTLSTHESSTIPAGWFWWPMCFVSACAAFLWMSNHPEHGNHSSNDKLWNVLFFYWFEGVGLGVGVIAIIILVATRNIPFFIETSGGQIIYNLMLVIIACVLQHLALAYLSPPSTKKCLREQATMFQDKHTWIMTFLYIMCFGSFIGFSGAFPKLITDLFGYLTTDGCFYTTDGLESFSPGGTEFDCTAGGGTWGRETISGLVDPADGEIAKTRTKLWFVCLFVFECLLLCRCYERNYLSNDWCFV